MLPHTERAIFSILRINWSICHGSIFYLTRLGGVGVLDAVIEILKIAKVRIPRPYEWRDPDVTLRVGSRIEWLRGLRRECACCITAPSHETEDPHLKAKGMRAFQGLHYINYALRNLGMTKTPDVYLPNTRAVQLHDSYIRCLHRWRPVAQCASSRMEVLAR